MPACLLATVRAVFGRRVQLLSGLCHPAAVGQSADRIHGVYLRQMGSEIIYILLCTFGLGAGATEMEIPGAGAAKTGGGGSSATLRDV